MQIVDWSSQWFQLSPTVVWKPNRHSERGTTYEDRWQKNSEAMAEGPPPEDFSKLPLEDKLSHKVRAARTEIFKVSFDHFLRSPFYFSFPSLPPFPSLNLFHPFPSLFLISANLSPPPLLLFHLSSFLCPSRLSLPSLSPLSPLSPLSSTGLESPYDGLRRSC